MADDVTFQTTTLATPPSGTVVSTDDVGGKQVQRMKLMDGTDAGSTMAKVSSEGNLQTITPNRTASGTLGALNDAVTIATDGVSWARFQFTASSFDSGCRIVLEGSSDGGTTWTGLQLAYQNGGNQSISYTWVQPVTGDEISAPVGGLTDVRIRVSLYNAGSADVTASLGNSTPVIQAIAVFDEDGVPARTGSGLEAQALRVTIASDSTGVLSVDDNGGALTVDNAGTFAVQDSAADTSLAILDDWDESDRAKVNPIAGQAGVQGGAGASTALTQRVALATDANTIQGTVTAAQATASSLNATVVGTGTFAVQADTELTTADLDTGAGTDTRAVVGLVGSKSGGAALIPGDATAGLKVDLGTDNDVTVTSGTITAVTAISNALPAGTNAIGKLAANSGVDIGDVDVTSIAAGDNNIGNVDIVTLPNVTLAAGTNTNEVVGDIAHDTGVGGNPVLIAGAAQDMDDTAPPNRVSAESDTTRLATDRDGVLFAHPHGPQIWSYHENSSSALTDTSVHAAPSSGLSLYVTDIVVSTGAATALNVFFEEGSTTVLGPYYLEAVAGRGLAIHFGTPKKITAATALTITTSAAIAHAIDITGFVGAG